MKELDIHGGLDSLVGDIFYDKDGVQFDSLRILSNAEPYGILTLKEENENVIEDIKGYCLKYNISYETLLNEHRDCLSQSYYKLS